MRISDWSSDVCSSDLLVETDWGAWEGRTLAELRADLGAGMAANEARGLDFRPPGGESPRDVQDRMRPLLAELARSEEHTSELQTLMRISYADFCWKKQIKHHT